MEVACFDVLVIGAGIAGASVAACLAQTCRVALLERESQPGYHSTGRSAALFSETYGNAAVRALSRASRNFLFSPPEKFCEHPLTVPRGALHVARPDQMDSLEKLLNEPDLAAYARRVDAIEAERLCPLLRPGYAAAGVYETDARDIDVHALHQGYLRLMRSAGGILVTDAGLHAIERTRGIWRAQSPVGIFEAPIVINAAGAWADDIAALAGASPLGIVPHRRTVVLVGVPSGGAFARMPLTIDADESFYFKPDAGRLLISPADETPSPPCDAQPDEIDIAIAIDRVQRATALEISRIASRWAGLRNFAPDRSPVIGFDPETEGFFWLAGQGGYGMQTAPAIARLAAALIIDGEVPDDLVAHGIMADALSPRRLRRIAAEIESHH
jgi:D-arginine dehydrogenase